MAKNGKSLALLTIEGKDYSIRASEHALQRMEERQVDSYVVAGNVMALGAERLQELQRKQEEAMIIDEENEVAVVIAFKGNRIMLVTVLNKANCYVKKGTRIERVS